jgi:cobalt/nickel transport system permease protein
MALPAVICYYAFRRLIHRTPMLAMIGSFACGFVSVLLSALLLGLDLVFTEKNFWSLSGLIIAANLPVMIIEGIITVFCVAFLKKVHPEMLNSEML